MAIKFIIDEKKIDRKTCQLTHKAMDKLEHQLVLIEQTTPFEKLFNNDAIKLAIFVEKKPYFKGKLRKFEKN